MAITNYKEGDLEVTRKLKGYVDTKLTGYSTSAQVDQKIADELATFDHLDYKIADDVPTPTEVIIDGETVETQTGVRYLVANASGSAFGEYVLIDGKIWYIGSTSDVDLTGYVTTTEFNALAERVTALETLMADFEETRLTMTDGTNTTDRIVLAKDAPVVEPVYETKFDLPYGAYDEDDNLLLGGADFWTQTGLSIDQDGENTCGYNYIDFDKLPAGTRGVVFPKTALNDCEVRWLANNTHTHFIAGDTDEIDWLVIPDSVAWVANFMDSDVWSGTIYYKGPDTEAPWGLTHATVNTEG